MKKVLTTRNFCLKTCFTSQFCLSSRIFKLLGVTARIKKNTKKWKSLL